MVKIGNLEIGEFPLLLAPMEDVSDPPFRAVCKENGADLMYTEFISAEGLIRDAVKSVQKLDIYDYERPIGIQIFGEKIDSMREAAAIAESAGPELIDINYGCPVKKVACKGAGAGILLDIPKMQKMTEEIVKQCKLPVTVKTRLGWDDQLVAQHRNAWPNLFRAARFIPATDYVNLSRQRTLLIQEMHELMKGYDVIVTPSFAGSQLQITNLTGHPALCMPNGFNESGSPTSITLLANLFEEEKLVMLGNLIQKNTDWQTQRPPLFNQ